MIKFDSDYLEGAHENIINALVKTNLEQTPGYGEDDYCRRAREYIKRDCKDSNADVHFLVGGTGTNTTVIASALRPYEGVISPVTGHINIHESGAIEGTGHKVIALPEHNGKLAASDIEEYCRNYYNDEAREHIVMPRMVYISFPTETGTLYSASELYDIRKVCDSYSLYLYADGARLGYGLGAKENDVTLPMLEELTDIFYIGGTKVGALFGEAVVIRNDELKKNFRYMQKRQGGMFAKGRLLGIQFSEMFRDGLYYELGRKGISQAEKLRKIFKDAGFGFLCDSPTNQQFPILPDSVIKKLSQSFSFEYWCRKDENHSCVRFCTSWATTDENIEALEKAVRSL